MNKLATILVDDEPRGLSALQKLLQFNCPEVEVIATCSSADEAAEKISLLKPQLVFLDIAMPKKSAFDLLQGLPLVDFEIIFVTAHNDYMAQAFRYSAVDYLLKPVEHNLLTESVKRAAKRISERSENNLATLLHNIQYQQSPNRMKLCIPSLKGFQVISLSEIVYCEASSNYTDFHFVNRPSICTSRPIHEYEALLADASFLRIHKSFLVNLEHIKEYIRGEGGSVMMSNGHEVEVSRRKKDQLMTRMKEYYKF